MRRTGWDSGKLEHIMGNFSASIIQGIPMFAMFKNGAVHLSRIVVIAGLSAGTLAMAQSENDPRLTSLTSDPNGGKISTQLLRLEHKQQVLGARMFLQPEVKA